MFQDAFTRLDRLESETILEEVNPALDTTRFRADSAVVMAQDLSFYPGYRFLDIAEYGNVPAVRRFVIYRPRKVVVLNWTNEPIYALNKEVPVRLTDFNIAEYVRFFFTYVRGRHGRFIIVETVDDISWREEPPPPARRAIGKMLLPVTIQERRPDGSWFLMARMIFRDSLFKSDIHVTPEGMITLSGEELLIEDMPVLDDTFGQ